MSTQLKLRRGTTAQHSTFTGAEGEITVDTTKDTVVVHDGSTAGGVPLAKESALSGLALDSAVVHNTGDETVAGVKTLSSNPILSGGTANGVAYLNGSKVLTTGSALTFDQYSNLSVAGAVSSSEVLVGPSNYKIYLRNIDGNNRIDSYNYPITGHIPLYINASTTVFNIADSEKMRINSSGNVGIGLTNPASKLTIGDNPPSAGAIAAVGSPGGVALALSDNVYASFYVRPAPGGAILGTDGGGALRFATNGNTSSDERMRIDTSGNVGIGSSAPTSKLQVVGLPVYANNAAAIAGGLTAGAFYRTGADPDPVCVVH